MTREQMKAAADASWGFGPTTEVPSLELEKERERADKAEAEVWRLQRLNERLAERIAAASEVIARNAERRK